MKKYIAVIGFAVLAGAVFLPQGAQAQDGQGEAAVASGLEQLGKKWAQRAGVQSSEEKGWKDGGESTYTNDEGTTYFFPGVSAQQKEALKTMEEDASPAAEPRDGRLPDGGLDEEALRKQEKLRQFAIERRARESARTGHKMPGSSD